MSTTRTLITAIVLALVTPTAIPESELSIRIEWEGKTIYADQTSKLDEAVGALELFSDLGLTLPDLTIEMRSSGQCPKSDGSGQIAGSMGLRNGEPLIKNCGGILTLYHELAHVWDRHNLSEVDRSRYLELRGLESWSNEQWDQAGGEHLAETISWALSEKLGRPERIPDNSLCEMRDGYRQLTGSEPPVLEGADALLKGCDRERPTGGTMLQSTDLEAGKNLG